MDFGILLKRNLLILYLSTALRLIESDEYSTFCQFEASMEMYRAYPNLFSDPSACRQVFQTVSNFNCLDQPNPRKTPPECFHKQFHNSLAFLLSASAIRDLGEDQIVILVRNDNLFAASKVHIIESTLGNSTNQASLAEKLVPVLKNDNSKAVKRSFLQLFTSIKPINEWYDSEFRLFSPFADSVSVDLIDSPTTFTSPNYLQKLSSFMNNKVPKIFLNILAKKFVYSSQISSSPLFFVSQGLNKLLPGKKLYRSDELQKLSETSLNYFDAKTLLEYRKLTWEEIVLLGRSFVNVLGQNNLPTVISQSLTFSMALEKLIQRDSGIPAFFALNFQNEVYKLGGNYKQLSDEKLKNIFRLSFLYPLKLISTLPCRDVLAHLSLIKFDLLRFDQKQVFFNSMAEGCDVLSYDLIELDNLISLGDFIAILPSNLILSLEPELLDQLAIRSDLRYLLLKFDKLPLKIQQLHFVNNMKRIRGMTTQVFIVMNLSRFLNGSALQEAVSEDITRAYINKDSFYISYSSYGQQGLDNLVTLNLDQDLVYLYYDSLICVDPKSCPFQKLTPGLVDSLGVLARGIRIHDVMTLDIYSVYSVAEALARDPNLSRKLSRALSVKLMSSYQSLYEGEFSLNLFTTAQLIGLGWKILAEFPPHVFENLPTEKLQVIVSIIGEDINPSFPKLKRMFLASHYVKKIRKSESDVNQVDFDYLGKLSCDFDPKLMNKLPRELMFNNLDKFSECCFNAEQIKVLRSKLSTEEFLNPLAARALSYNYFFIVPISDINIWHNDSGYTFLAQELYPFVKLGFRGHINNCQKSLFLIDKVIPEPEQIWRNFEIVSKFVWKRYVKSLRSSCQSFSLDSITCSEIRAMGEGNLIWSQKDIQSLGSCEVRNCIGFVGANLELFSDLQARTFLDLVFRELIIGNQTNLLTKSNIFEMGSLVTYFTINELQNLKLFQDRDFISYLEQFTWSPKQTSVIYNKSLKLLWDLTTNRDSFMTNADILVMGSLLCGMPETQTLYQWVSNDVELFRANLNMFVNCSKSIKQTLEALLGFNLSSSRFSFERQQVFQEIINSYSLKKLFEGDMSLLEQIKPETIAKWDPNILVGINSKFLSRLSPEQIGGITKRQWSYMVQYLDKETVLQLFRIYFSGVDPKKHPFVQSQYDPKSYEASSLNDEGNVQYLDDIKSLVTSSDDYQAVYQTVQVRYITAFSCYFCSLSLLLLLPFAIIVNLSL